MKIVIIIILILIIFFGYLVVSGEKQRKAYEENIKLITVENFELIRDSPYTDELSEYIIFRNENELRFSSKDGWTLFLLLLKKEEPNGVKLRGLASYGIRDREFLKYTANLIRKINEKKN